MKTGGRPRHLIGGHHGTFAVAKGPGVYPREMAYVDEVLELASRSDIPFGRGIMQHAVGRVLQLRPVGHRS